MTLPEWSDFPKEAGMYLHADRFGRVGLVELLKVPTRDYGLFETARGAMGEDPDMAPWAWCGPLKAEHLFPKAMRDAHVAAFDDIPAAKVRRAERVLKDNPRSRNAKRDLDEARADLAKHAAESAAPGGAS